MPGRFQDVKNLPQPAVDFAWDVAIPTELPGRAQNVLSNTVDGLVDDHGPEAISIVAKSVGFNPMNLQSEEAFSGLSYATGREFNDFTITFYENKDWNVHRIFQAWSEEIFRNGDRYSARGRSVVRPPETYATSLEIELVDMRVPEGEPGTKATYSARHAWPVQLEEVDLDYENDSIETFQVTFKSHIFQLKEAQEAGRRFQESPLA